MAICTAEYLRSTAVQSSQAHGAYQGGWSGQGVKVGVVDSGIASSLAELAGRVDPASTDVTGGARGSGDTDGHGTAVSAVIAANRNNSGIHGIAYNATIVMAKADTPGSCTSNDGCSFGDSAIAQGIDLARAAGAKVVNLSLGGSGPGPVLTAAMSRAVNAGMILVISAGNDGETATGGNPDAFALQPAQQFAGSVIIAGSLGTAANSRDISTFSNRAGVGAQYYLTAQGYRVLTVDHTGGEFFYSGTSFSAPTIAGAAALLAQAFPSLTGQQIVSILFNSADDLGAAGTDGTFGRGALNLVRAFQPSGTTSLADSKVAVGEATTGSLPAASGDAGTSGAAKSGLGAIVLDGYSRAFTINLAAGLRAAERAEPLRRSLAGRLRQSEVATGPLSVAMTIAINDRRPGFAELAELGIEAQDAAKARLVAASAIARLDSRTKLAFGFAGSAKDLERRLANAETGAFLVARDSSEPGFTANRDGSLALRRNLGPVGVTLSGETGQVWRENRLRAEDLPYNSVSIAFDKDFGGTWLMAGISRLDEKRTVLGGRLGTAFGGSGGAATTFLDAELRRELGGDVTAILSARRGWTTFGGGAFETSAYSFDLSKRGIARFGDRLGLRISQPLRVEQGGFALTLPTAYDYATASATTSTSRMSLTPSGRELDAELSYGAPLLGGWFGGNAFVRRNPGHVAGSQNDYGAALRLGFDF